MLLSPRKNGLTSLFKEIRVFKEWHYRQKFILELVRQSFKGSLPCLHVAGTIRTAIQIELCRGSVSTRRTCSGFCRISVTDVICRMDFMCVLFISYAPGLKNPHPRGHTNKVILRQSCNLLFRHAFIHGQWRSDSDPARAERSLK